MSKLHALCPILSPLHSSCGVLHRRIWLLAGIAGARVVARFMDVDVVGVLAFGLALAFGFTVAFGLASAFGWGFVFVFGLAFWWCSWSHLGWPSWIWSLWSR